MLVIVDDAGSGTADSICVVCVGPASNAIDV